MHVITLLLRDAPSKTCYVMRKRRDNERGKWYLLLDSVYDAAESIPQHSFDASSDYFRIPLHPYEAGAGTVDKCDFGARFTFTVGAKVWKILGRSPDILLLVFGETIDGKSLAGAAFFERNADGS